MAFFSDASAQDGPHKRWYDRDPALSRMMGQLEAADSAYQAQVALNVIKILLEHQLEAEVAALNHLDAQLDSNLDEPTQTTADSVDHWRDTCTPYPLKRRWYDMNETLRAAITLLQECPPELQSALLPQIAAMVEQTLANGGEEELPA